MLCACGCGLPAMPRKTARGRPPLYATRTCQKRVARQRSRARSARAPRACSSCGAEYQPESARHLHCSKTCAQRTRLGFDAQASRWPATRYLASPEIDAHIGADYRRSMRRDPCSLCNEPSDALDHIEPREYGGSNHWSNYAPLCHSCNANKGTRPLLTHLLAQRIERELTPLLAERSAVLGIELRP